MPRAGFDRQRIGTVHLLAGCKRWLNQAQCIVCIILVFLWEFCVFTSGQLIIFGCIQLFCFSHFFISWFFWFGCPYQCMSSTGKARLWNDLWRVDGAVKPCSLTHSVVKLCSADAASEVELTVCVCFRANFDISSEYNFDDEEDYETRTDTRVDSQLMMDDLGQSGLDDCQLSVSDCWTTFSRNQVISSCLWPTTTTTTTTTTSTTHHHLHHH